MANSPQTHISHSGELYCVLCGGKLEIIKEGLQGTTTKADALYSFTLCKCVVCGHIQKRIDSYYQSVMDELYRSDYASACGQRINIVNGKVVSRYYSLAENLIKILSLDKIDGRFLDIGAGSGDLINAFSKLLPRWTLAGHDVSGSNAAIVRSSGASVFYDGDLDNIQETFDLIVLNHVAEHLTEPVRVLKQTSRLLKPNGHIVVIVPCFELVHPDLFFFEHCSHFNQRSLHLLALLSGLEVVDTMKGSLGKIEVGFIAKRQADQGDHLLETALSWCQSLPQIVNNNTDGRRLGLFGVSGAGLWLGPLSKDKISFFVDDDPAKQGKVLAGNPIIAVDKIQTGDTVFVPFNNAEESLKMCDNLRARRPDVIFWPADRVKTDR